MACLPVLPRNRRHQSCQCFCIHFSTAMNTSIKPAIILLNFPPFPHPALNCIVGHVEALCLQKYFLFSSPSIPLHHALSFLYALFSLSASRSASLALASLSISSLSLIASSPAPLTPFLRWRSSYKARLAMMRSTISPALTCWKSCAGTSRKMPSVFASAYGSSTDGINDVGPW